MWNAQTYGYAAARCGKPHTANPHQPHTKDWCSWARGWRNARVAIATRNARRAVAEGRRWLAEHGGE